MSYQPMEACLKDGWLQEECDRLHEQSAAIKRLKDSLYAHREYGMGMGPVEVQPRDLQLALELLRLLSLEDGSK